jgi:spermidine synthase
MERRSATIALAGLGFAAAISQAALLREAMAALAGSELAWGAVLALWLAGMGLGAWFGVRLHRGGAWDSLAVVMVMAALVGVVVLRAAPRLVGAVSGEVVSTWQTVWVWVLAVLPPAVVGGLAFPVLAASLASDEAAGEAYALEGGGALAGGLVFTFLLSPLGSAGALVVALGVVSALWCMARGRIVVGAAVAIAGLVAASPAAQWVEVHGWRWSGHVGELAAWEETREQRLELAGRDPRALYADGRLVASYPDPYRTVPMAHLLLLLHPHPRSVVMVGSLADATLPVMLEHPVERLVLAEEDARLAAVVPGWLGGPVPAAMHDQRVEVRSGDPLRVVEGLGQGWDLILLLDGDPSTLRRNRTRTVGFFRTCARRLGQGGLLVVRTGVSDTYLGGVGGRLLATLASSLKEALPEVRGVPGEEVLLVAGRHGATAGLDSTSLKGRWRALGIRAPSFSPAMIDLFLDPVRAPALQAFLTQASGPSNTAAHPRAVLAAAMLVEARAGLPLVRLGLALEGLPASMLWILVTVAGAVLVARGVHGGELGGQSAVIVGFAGMSWWLLLLAAWQSTMGSVYAQVGALSAAFMVGLVAGSALGTRVGRRAQTGLATLLIGGVVVSLMIAAGAPLVAPRAVVVPLLVSGGLLTGAAFPLVAERAGSGDIVVGAGRSFAADEVGAALAALGVGIVALPWVGMEVTALAVSALQAAAALALLLAGRRRRLVPS